jgi:hypothetical protein
VLVVQKILAVNSRVLNGLELTGFIRSFLRENVLNQHWYASVGIIHYVAASG